VERKERLVEFLKNWIIVTFVAVLFIGSVCGIAAGVILLLNVSPLFGFILLFLAITAALTKEYEATNGNGR